MELFNQALRDWQLFFSTVALAAATLAGLLFVSLSIRHEVLRGRKDERLLRLARGSFADFLYVLMLGLIFLVPHPVPAGLAVALFVLGASRGYGLLHQWLRRSKRARAEKLTAMRALSEIALPAAASLGLIAVGVEVLRGDMESIYALVMVVAALLATASTNAWLILVEENRTGER